jgi:hypothetical protein
MLAYSIALTIVHFDGTILAFHNRQQHSSWTRFQGTSDERTKDERTRDNGLMLE